MSITLPNQNLASLAVGQSGKIDLSDLYGGGGIPKTLSTIAGNQGVLRLHNDSGSGLRMTLNNSGQQFNVPAGGWQDCYPGAGDTTLTYTVQYVLPNPPVTLLMATYYYPSESIPAITTLGNSPVGIGGTVNVSSVQTLSNENNGRSILVIDIGDPAATSPAGIAQLIQLFTDHFSMKVDQAGTAHQVLAGSTTGNPAQIGQAGDTSEVLGNLLVDNALTVKTGIFTANGSQGMLGWAWGNASTGAGGNVIITHGLGVIPSAILLTERGAVNDIFSVTNPTSTTFQANVSVTAVRGFSWLAIQ